MQLIVRTHGRLYAVLTSTVVTQVPYFDIACSICVVHLPTCIVSFSNSNFPELQQTNQSVRHLKPAGLQTTTTKAQMEKETELPYTLLVSVSYSHKYVRLDTDSHLLDKYMCILGICMYTYVV